MSVVDGFCVVTGSYEGKGCQPFVYGISRHYVGKVECLVGFGRGLACLGLATEGQGWLVR